MARGPGGAGEAPELDEGSGLNRAELEFTRGIEKIIDRALAGIPPGQPFIYGIHQGLSPRMMDALRARYRQAGWSEVILKEGLTGAYLLTLQP